MPLRTEDSTTSSSVWRSLRNAFPATLPPDRFSSARFRLRCGRAISVSSKSACPLTEARSRSPTFPRRASSLSCTSPSRVDPAPMRGALMKRWSALPVILLAAAPLGAQSEGEDEYTRYELLAPETASFRILYDVTATTPGARFFFNPIRKGSGARDESVLDLATGEALEFEVVGGTAGG